jgi:quinoprotein glucose dehydrogenase
MEWGGSAADPNGILYVNINEIPWFYQLLPTSNVDGEPFSFGERNYRIQCAACHGLDRAGAPEGGFPALRDIASRHSKETVTQIMMQGGGRMPAFDRLPERTRNAIVAFLFGDEPPGDPASSNRSGEDAEMEPEDAYEPPYVFRGFVRWQDDEGYQAIKPPWGTLNAVDLNTGDIKWKVPLGEYAELTARGIPVTGTENYGGPVVTAGGLVFIAATNDRKIRAFDRETGEILWVHDLPFDGHSTPSTYMVDGRQYVVISAGGYKLEQPLGSILVAFALPE